jgi:hypothetical protein
MAEYSLEEVYQLHADLVKYGATVQHISRQRLKESKHLKPLFFDLGTKIGSYIITLHRATRALVDAGWAHATPLLLRGMMEGTVNYLTVMYNGQPEYMAFKYFAHDYFRVIVDPKVQGVAKARADVQNLISRVIDPESRRKAEGLISSVLSGAKIETFWFQREKDSLKDCILGVADAEMREGLLSSYKTLSKTTHGTHFGMALFRDNLNDCDINPSDNPQRAFGTLLLSSKLLIEFLAVRCRNEKLELESDYIEFLTRAQLLAQAYQSAESANREI